MDGLMPSNKSVTLLPALLREHLPNTIIPTSDPNDPLNRIGTLLQEANRQQSAGHFRDAELSISEARRLAQGHTQALAEIDFFCALSLLEQHKGDEGIQSLSAVLIQHRAWFNTPEGRDLYELLQVQRAFSLIHLERKEEARPLLEEAVAFQLDIEVRSDVHCHLGRCYHELSLHTLAREQFERANAVGVSEEWQPAFHYYYGYTLYDLREFQLAKREFILCLQSGASGPEEWMRCAMLAATSRKLGEHSEARAYDEKATSLKP
jgi:tetratricopeptide (TPR) repeat protein